MRDLRLLLWSEMSTEELEAYRDHWVREYMKETGCDTLVAEIRFEDYAGQEGYAGRDERIAMRRDKIFEKFPTNVTIKPIDVVVTYEGEFVFVEHFGQGDVHFGLFKPNGNFHRYVEWPALFLKSVVGEAKARGFVGRVPGDWGYDEYWARRRKILVDFPPSPSYTARRVVDDSRGEFILVEHTEPGNRYTLWGLYTPDGKYVRGCNSDGR